AGWIPAIRLMIMEKTPAIIKFCGVINSGK
ncbi:hypothetical protein C5S42_08300, partial [Candidatus Methanomarinus sp.]